VATEASPLNPQTAYARSKVKAEQAIGALASDTFSPTFLRNGTIYGLSPRMRFDTVLNNLVGVAVATGHVTVHSDGTPWRPVLHVEDVARAFQTVLEAPREAIHNEAINIGANHLNYRIRDLAEMAVATVPGSTLSIVAQPDADQRTYRADFTKFATRFPSFTFNWTARRGAMQLAECFRAVRLRHQEFADKRFTRLTWLHHLIDIGQLDGSLRWRAAQSSTA
jgi:nucleoside-diphosphate-sugar epimerase